MSQEKTGLPWGLLDCWRSRGAGFGLPEVLRRRGEGREGGQRWFFRLVRTGKLFPQSNSLRHGLPVPMVGDFQDSAGLRLILPGRAVAVPGQFHPPPGVIQGHPQGSRVAELRRPPDPFRRRLPPGQQRRPDRPLPPTALRVAAPVFSPVCPLRPWRGRGRRKKP